MNITFIRQDNDLLLLQPVVAKWEMTSRRLKRQNTRLFREKSISAAILHTNWGSNVTIYCIDLNVWIK